MSHSNLSEVPLSENELLDLHECIVSTETNGEICSSRDCNHEADVIAAAPAQSKAFPVCADCLPGFIEWYELKSAEQQAERTKREISASLDSSLKYVRNG